MALTNNNLEIIEAIAKNDIHRARMAAMASLAEDTSKKNADMVKYYRKLLVGNARMLECLNKREIAEKDMLIEIGGEAFVEAHSDWDAILCEWKIANNIHSLSPTRVKKFLMRQ